MKRLLAVLLMGLLLVGCAPTAESVTMFIKDGSLTNEGCILVVTDTHDTPCTFGEPFWLEQKVDGQWVALPYARSAGEMVWTMIGYAVGPSGQMELEVNWLRMYGALAAGQYRITKEYTTSGWQIGEEKPTLSVEFTIKETV